VAIAGSGWYGPTLEKFFIGTALPTSSLESETATKAMLILDAYTPAYDTHDFRNDVTANEVSGTSNYTAGGNVLTATEVTFTAGVWTYDTADPSWPASTIPNAMAAVIYFARGGADTADELILLSDFVTAASSSSGTFTVQVPAAGWANLDFVPP
jgi:hypothetical protein